MEDIYKFDKGDEIIFTKKVSGYILPANLDVGDIGQVIDRSFNTVVGFVYRCKFPHIDYGCWIVEETITKLIRHV